MIDWLKRFTADLNQPAFKAVVAASLSVGSGLVYWVLQIIRAVAAPCTMSPNVYAVCKGDMQDAIWIGWLTFLGALWGVTAWDYSTKRNTTMDNAQRAALKQAQVETDPQEREPPPPAEQGG
jgi:cbb3-type cytochrome oxidase subunit 3